MITGILTAIGSIASQWLSNKADKSKAKHTRDIKLIEQTSDWEAIQAQNASTSWKDEWLTLLFSVPLVMCFIPPLVPYVKEGFLVLDMMPEWYRYYLGVIVAASFGVRQVLNFKK